MAAPVPLVIVMVAAGPAAGYVIGGSTWPGGVIRYHNADPADAPEVAAAAKAWNKSGAHVHFIAVSAGRAQVTVVPWPKRSSVVSDGADGMATLGRTPPTAVVPDPTLHHFVRGAHVWLRPVNRAKGLPPFQVTLIAAHEFGHVLGLQHSHRCATMDAAVDDLCRQPPHPWQYACRVLQPDDIAGAVARYGGKAHASGPQYCDFFGPPAPPSQLTATLVSGSSSAVDPVNLRWRAPKGVRFTAAPGYSNSIGYYRAYATAGHCSTAQADEQGQDSERPGAIATTQVYPTSPGRWCFSVETLDIFSRASKPVSVWLTVPGPPPTANFNYTQNETNGLLFAFADASTAAAGTIVRYSWNFGDPASGPNDTSAAENPAHIFTASGSYQVTETVTDSYGQTNTATQTVYVQDYTPPVAGFDDGCSVDAQCSLSAEDPYEVDFGDDSYDDDGALVSWSWNFGDPGSGPSNTSNQQYPYHDYGIAGSYTVTLTVTDEHGKSNTTSQTVYIDP